MKIQLISPLSQKSDLFQPYVLLSFFFQINTTCFDILFPNSMTFIQFLSVAWASKYFEIFVYHYIEDFTRGKKDQSKYNPHNTTKSHHPQKKGERAFHILKVSVRPGLY